MTLDRALEIDELRRNEAKLLRIGFSLRELREMDMGGVRGI